MLGSPTALLKWMVAGPEIARMVNEFEETAIPLADETHESHHEDTKAFETRFQHHVKNLVNVFEDEGNPCE